MYLMQHFLKGKLMIYIFLHVTMFMIHKFIEINQNGVKRN